MAEQVRIQLTVDGKTGSLVVADKRIKQVDKTLKKTARSAKAASVGFGGLASSLTSFIGIAAGLQFFNVAIAEAGETEIALDNVAASMQSLGDFSTQALSTVQKFAEGLEAVTGVSENAILEQFALAKSFVNTNEEALKLTKTALDFGAAARLNFEESVRRLGRAVQGSSADLANFAPIIRTLTAEQLRAGGATDIIAAKFEGRAAQAADNFSGRMRTLGLRIRDAAGDMANSLVPAIDELGGAFGGTLTGLTRVGSVIGLIITSAVSGILLVTRTLINSFATAASVSSKFFTGLRELSQNNITAGLKSIGSITDVINDSFEQLKKDVTSSAKSIQQSIDNTIATITGNAAQQEKIRSEITKAGADDRLALTKDEITRRKVLLAQDLANVQANLALEFAERNITRQQRFDLVRQAQIDEIALVNSAFEATVLREDEQTAKLLGIRRARTLELKNIENESQEAIARANEAFGDKIINTDARIAEAGRKAFDSLGQAVGKSFADSIVDGKNFSESFKALWKDIKRQVIIQITAMIAKLLALKLAQAALGGFGFIGGAAAANGGRFAGLGPGKPIRKLRHGGRTNGPEVAVIGEGRDTETVVPDGQARGFALGVLAGQGAPGGSTRRGSAGASSVSVSFGDINMSFSGPINTDNPAQIDAIMEGMAQRLRDKVEVAIRTARLMSDSNEEESDRAV
ncbi:MAG: hypothetical protein V3T23_04015 [Nitrososphaerales archaeon]